MNKVLTCLAAVAVMSVGVFAAGNDPSERGVPTSVFKTYSGGVGLGAMMAASEALEEECGGMFFKVVLSNTWQFREDVSLFADANWYISETVKNVGVEVGVDYLFSTSSVRPFIGAGFGGHYFYRNKSSDGTEIEFGHKFGPSVVAHFGLAIDVTETAAVRFRIPYRAVLNDPKFDQGFGMDISVMFSSRFKNIKKLNY